MLELRPYQREAVAAIWAWFARGGGNGVVVLPTASGKSLVQAQFVKEAVTAYPLTRVLLISHVKELLQQNAAELLGIWPDAPIGIFSAGLKRRDVGAQITVAGIQSVHKRAMELGHFDIIIVDEAHLLPHEGDGTYRAFMAKQREINPSVKVIGLSASPFRTKTGMLHKGKGALFEGIIYEAGVRRLIDEGYLCALTTPDETLVQADVSGVGTRAGEFIPKQLAAAVDRDELTRAAIDQTMRLCATRNSWLVFCTGVEHAHHVRDEIRSRGISCETVTGDTPADERTYIIDAFRAGALRAVTNCDVLTTGFNARNVDALVMLRPTKSPGLYIQIAGRGMRLHPSKQDCLVLDFAGNIERHGPIDLVNPKARGGAATGEGDAPTKECPQCQALVLIAAMECPDCGHRWESKPAHDATASVANILSERFKPKIETVPVKEVRYLRHKKMGKPDSVRVEYRAGLRSFSEWICFSHEGFARQKAIQWWAQRSADTPPASTDEFINRFGTETRFGLFAAGDKLREPTSLRLNVAGKHPEIVGYEWEQKQQQEAA